MRRAVALVALVLVAAGCTSHSDKTWIDPAIGRVPVVVDFDSAD